MRRAIVVVFLGALVLTVALRPGSRAPVAAAAPAATPTTDSSDFDGDGYADLAIGAPFDDVGGNAGAGVVHVLYGGPTGLGTSGSQVFDQNRSDIADIAEPGDHFGWALATGDLNSDGKADLAIGIPGEDLTIPGGGGGGGIAPDAGAVEILFGSPDGLSSSGSVFHAPTYDAPSQAGDQRGYALAMLDAKDFEGPAGVPAPDGYADLAIGMPGHDGDRGSVWVIAGQCLVPNPPLCAITMYSHDTWDAGARAGSVLVGGDFLSGRLEDLAIGAPYADTDGTIAGVEDAGLVEMVNTTTGARTIVRQGGPWPQAREPRDHLGWALASGDIDGDGREDLLIGVPDEDLGGFSNAGLVEIIIPTTTGLGDPAARLIHQDSPGIPGSRRDHARFGAALATGDLGKGADLDVAIGIPGWDRPDASRAGAVAVLYGSSGGPATSGNQLWTQDSSGILDGSEANDRFGSVLFAVDFGRSGLDDLGVGVPFEDINGLANAGLAQVLYGSAAGLSADGDQRWHQDVPGIGESAQAGDRFGSSVQ